MILDTSFLVDVLRGEHVGDTDVMVAATAMVEDEPVVTGDADHFDRVEGVEVLGY